MRVSILSLFPNYFDSPLNSSVLGRAIKDEILEINLVDLRAFSTRKGGRVDDQTFGTGPGMVIETAAVLSAYEKVASPKSRFILLTPAGRPLDTELLKDLAQEEELVFLCGHYEGVDERAASFVDDRVSVGDYVLTNGCLAALVVLDALSRFLVGVVGNEDSVKQDSFEHGILDCPHYTRPRNFLGVAVPSVLFSGNHSQIVKYRKALATEATLRFRPDLFISANEHFRKGTICLLRCVPCLSYIADWYGVALGFMIESREENLGLSVVFGTACIRFICVTSEFFDQIIPMQIAIWLNVKEWEKCACSLRRLDWPFVVSKGKDDGVEVRYLRVADPYGLELILMSDGMVV